MKLNWIDQGAEQKKLKWDLTEPEQFQCFYFVSSEAELPVNLQEPIERLHFTCKLT